MVPGVIRCGEHESGVQTPRNSLVDQKPMEIEYAGNTFCLGLSMWETQLHRPNTLKANGPPSTDGVRAGREIPHYSRLEEELKSCFHF